MTLQALGDLQWQDWISYHEACMSIPPVEGIYKARRRLDGAIVYVGKAGKRKRYNGLQGRFRMYVGGNMTGLAENALTQVLREPNWIRNVADEAERGVFLAGADLVRRAVNYADLEITWAECAGVDGATLLALERAVRAGLRQEDLWSRH